MKRHYDRCRDKQRKLHPLIMRLRRSGAIVQPAGRGKHSVTFNNGAGWTKANIYTTRQLLDRFGNRDLV